MNTTNCLSWKFEKFRRRYLVKLGNIYLPNLEMLKKLYRNRLNVLSKHYRVDCVMNAYGLTTNDVYVL